MLALLSAAVALHPLAGRAQLATARASVRLLCSENLSRYTVMQLKEKLRDAGLPVSGRKAELIARLAAPEPAAPILDPINAVLASAALPHVEIEHCKS
eukprot:3765254-Prymnesium_polylepis.1